MKFIILLFPFLLFSQEKAAKGIVVDSITNEPIPYVNISVLGSQLGTSTNEDGSYNLKIDSGLLENKIHISSLGYKDTLFVVSSFIRMKEIRLNPMVEALDEVVISQKKKEDFVEINSIKKKRLRGGYAAGSKPWILALHFPYDDKYSKTEFLNRLKIYVNRSNYIKKSKSKFRIRIYEVNNEGMPGDDLLTEDIIVETTKKQKEAVVDLSEFNIDFPKGDFLLHLRVWQYHSTRLKMFQLM